MEKVMIRLLNMSFAAGCAVLLVMALRLLFRKLPKGYSYGLWLIVLFRFLCPIVIPSSFSLFPVNPEPMRQEIVYEQKPEIETGVIWVDRAVNHVVGESLAVKNPENSVNPIQVYLGAGFLIWTAGMILFAGYHLVQFAALRKKLETAVWVEERELLGTRKQVPVWETDRFWGAFVLGIFHPVIYLPAGLEEESKEYVLCHEMVHIQRKDYVIKILGLLMVTVHWFNPLSWIAFREMCLDMEMSCDEHVLGKLKKSERKAYSQVLLAEAEKGSGLLSPVAFGKNSVYRRIRNILVYHKPGAALTVLALIGLAVISVGLMTSPVGDSEESMETEEGKDGKEAEAVSIIGGADGPTSIFLAGKLGGEEESGWQRERPESQWLASVQVMRDLDRQGFESGEEERESSEVFLDFASDNSLIFHGDFGLFSFGKENGRWKQKFFTPDVQVGEELARTLEQIIPDGGKMSEESLHPEDSFFMEGNSASEPGARHIGCAAGKMADGRIGILGSWDSEEGNGRLVDLYYGYYEPGEQKMTQVFLFMGDGREQKNPKGEIRKGRWLFERDGFDYYVRTPENALEFEKTEYVNINLYHIAYGRMELARSKEGRDELLDSLVYMEEGSVQKMVLTEERLIYMGFEKADVVSMKRTLPISICLDGSGRQVGKVPYGTAEGLCYDDGYIYYEGWTNDGTFPKPLMRIKDDFTEEEKVGDLPGSLITVRDGGICLWMDWEKMCIMAADVENTGDPKRHWKYLADGETGRKETCRMEKEGDVWMKIVLQDVEEPFKEKVYRVLLPSGRSF